MVKCWENICNIQFSHNFCGKEWFSTLLEKVQTVSLMCIKHIGSMDSFKVGLRQVYFSIDLAQKRLMGFFLLPVVDLLQSQWQQKCILISGVHCKTYFATDMKNSRLSLLWCMAIHYIDGREPHANKPVWAICRKQNISFKMWSMICRQIWCRSLSRQLVPYSQSYT